MEEEKKTRGLVAIRLTESEWKAMRYIMRLYKWGEYCPLDYTGEMGGKKSVKVFRAFPHEKLMIRTLVKLWRVGMDDDHIRETLIKEGIELPSKE